MDPKACLDLAERQIDYLDHSDPTEEQAENAFNTTAKALSDYMDWRNNGGFEPENGDKRCADLVKQLGEFIF